MMKLWRLGLQYAKFGGVGLCSTATHVGVYSALIEFLSVAPLISNFFAFCVAVGVSFFGHFHWTFASEGNGRRPARTAFLRFLVTALVGLGLNSLIVYLVDKVLGLHYFYSVLGMLFLVPPFLFIMSKYWAFQEQPTGEDSQNVDRVPVGRTRI